MRNLVLLLVTLFSTQAFGQLAPIAQQYESNINLLENPGFEYGLAKWTASTPAHLTKETSTVGTGAASGEYDAAGGAGATLRSSNLAVPKILENRPCLASIYYLADAIATGDYSLKAELDDGTDLTAELSLAQTNGAWRNAFVSFTCPASDSIRLVIESEVSDPAVIYIDQAHLGGNKNEILATDSNEIVAHAYFATTTNCQWSRSSATLGAFSTDADCPAITVDTSSPTVSINTADTDLPQIVFSSLPAGNYELSVTGQAKTDGTNRNLTIAVNDGTSSKGYVAMFMITASERHPWTSTSVWTHTGGAKTFAVWSASDAGAHQLPAVDANERLTFTLKRFSKESSSKVTLETQGWHINSTITGTNPSLGTAAITSYTEITNGSLTLANVGSANAQIVCSTTNPPTGTTCSAGNEGLGVSFTPPYAGHFQVCANFVHSFVLDSADAIAAGFRLVETPINAQTILQSGSQVGTDEGEGAATTSNFGVPLHICGVFNFTSVSQKAIRLMYMQAVSGTVNSSSITTDGNTPQSGAANNATFTIYPITQNFPQAVALTDLVSDAANCTATKEFCSGKIASPAFTVASETCGGNSPTNSNNAAYWTKVGDIVTVYFEFECHANAGGQEVIFTLPSYLQPNNNFASTDEIHGVGNTINQGIVAHNWVCQGVISAKTLRMLHVTTGDTDNAAHSATCRWSINN